MPGIEHYLIDKPSELLSLASQNLIDLGSVYINHTRANQNLKLKEGDYLRVHTQPKRYPVGKIDWNQLTIYEDRDLMIIDKPYGIPVHPTLDNALENVLVAMRKFKGQELFHTHRLDIGTQGVLILAKNLPTQAKINEAFMRKEIKKFYVAQTENPVNVGRHVHYMMPSARAPKILSREEQPNWKKCELVVTSNVWERATLDDSNGGSYTSEIELITGRSHQIRAQLAFEGSPIIGDSLYKGISANAPNYQGEFFCLACIRIELPAGVFSRPAGFY